MIFSQKKYNNKILLIIFFIFFNFFLFFSINSAEAAIIPVFDTTERGDNIKIGTYYTRVCPYPAPPCVQYTCGKNGLPNQTWYEYKSDSPEREPTIKRQTGNSRCGIATSCCTCGPCRVTYDPEKEVKQCGSWQVSKVGEGNIETRRNNSLRWGIKRPQCYLRGEFIDIPSILRFYNNPNYPTNIISPEQSVNRNNILLPVKFDWDDVRGWKDGWVEQRRKRECPNETQLGDKYPTRSKDRSECVQTYQVIIRGREPTTVEAIVAGTGEKRQKGTMRDCKVLEIINNLKEKIERGEGDVRTHNDRIRKLKDEELIIAEYRVMIEYNKNEVLVEYIKENGRRYRDTISGHRISEVSSFRLGKSEIIVPIPFGPCFFQSNRAYELKIRACGDPPETKNIFGNDNQTEHYPLNCGKWSEWQPFFTNPAPEPIPSLIIDRGLLDYTPSTENPSPIPLLANIFDYGDRDWTGKGKAINQPLKKQLRWCETDFIIEENNEKRKHYPSSYKIRLFKVQNEQEVCHPSQKFGTECRPKIKAKDIIIREYPKPKFENEKEFFFTKENIYAWQVAACIDIARQRCTDYSQKWRFQIVENLKPPNLIRPPNDPNGLTPVSLPVLIEWKNPLGAKSFIYNIYQNNVRIIQGKIISPSQKIDYPKLQLDTIYSWRVLPCWDRESNKCETDAWSEKWYFRTTGRPPKLETMKPQGDNIPIPTRFEWENVPGAKSFIFKISGGNLDKQLTIEEAKTFLEFPDLHEETTYTWQVKTCARTGGRLCGEWSQTQTFTTFQIEVPTNLIINPHQENNPAIIFTGDFHEFSWNLHASYYQLELTYQRADDENRDECITLEQEIKILNKNSLNHRLECRGNYQWRVRGCLNRECTEGGVGEWSEMKNVSLIARIAPERLRGGLVPCGIDFDNPNTPWNETDRCQLKHIFKVLYLVLNFFLWTIIPLVLVILVVITGAMFYLSLSIGTTETIPKVKGLWKAAGIGFIIIFFAWTIVSWVLTILGYQVGIFGPWWQI